MITFGAQFELISMASVEKLSSLDFKHKKHCNLIENINYRFLCVGFPISKEDDLIRVRSSLPLKMALVNNKTYNVSYEDGRYVMLKPCGERLKFRDIYAEIGPVELGVTLFI